MKRMKRGSAWIHLAQPNEHPFAHVKQWQYRSLQLDLEYSAGRRRQESELSGERSRNPTPHTFGIRETLWSGRYLA